MEMEDNIIEEEKQEVETPEISSENELSLPSVDNNSLKDEAINITNKLVKAESNDDMKMYIELFNRNMAKKNAVRILKLNDLLDKVNDEAIERFEKRPAEICNKELLDYMRIVQESIANAQNNIDKLDEKPMIQINNNKSEVNVVLDNFGLKDSDSKNKVIDAVTELLKLAESASDNGNIIEEKSEDNIVDVNIQESGEE